MLEGPADVTTSAGCGRFPRRRIALWLAGAIRDRQLAPGSRLPSVRRLAGRIGVHRNTVLAAYRELAVAGMVVRMPGSGVYVAELGRAPGGDAGLSSTDPACSGSTALRFRAFVDRERAGGTPAAEVAGLLARWSACAASSRLLVVEPSEELRELLVHEVRAVTGRSVSRAACVEAVAGASLREALADPRLLMDRVPLARLAVLRRLDPALPAWQVPVPLILSGGSREMALLDGLPAGSIVALVTRCRAVRRLGRQLLGLRTGTRLGVTTPRPDDRGALARAVRVASLLLADAACTDLGELRGGPPAFEIRLLSRVTRGRLRSFLRPPGAGAPIPRFPTSGAAPARARNLFGQLG